MAKHSKPRAGSLAFRPRKRAKKETPRIHSWVDSGETKPLGFAGYKAGMTHVLAIDHRKNSPTSGLEISIPVTVIDTPPLVVAGIRAYVNGYLGKETFTDIFSMDLSDDIKRKIRLPKKIDIQRRLKEMEENLEKIEDIRLIVQTQPRLTSLGKRKPDIMEIAIGGNLKEKFEFAKKMLGKEIDVEEVLSENRFVDVTAVTKGKGFQGVIKRFGTRKQPRKAGKGRRHIGSGGSWKPARKLWTEPLPGQLGYHTRTEYNKVVLGIGKEGKDVTPKGDFLHYGPIKGSYVLLSGSIPGPAKRLIRLSNARRPKKDVNFEITHINVSSKQGR